MSLKGSKRGYGVCSQCTKEYCNRKKTKFCSCGNFLGGSFVKRQILPKIIDPACVCIYDSENGKLLSVKVNPKGDRQFVHTKDGQTICYSSKCKQLRAVSVASNKLEHFK